MTQLRASSSCAPNSTRPVAPAMTEGNPMKNLRFRLMLLATAVLLAGTFGRVLAETVTVLVHDSFSVSEDVLQGFTDATGIELVLLPAGDAGEVVNRAILTKSRPLADVLYGIDNSLIERARAEDLFEPYRSPALDSVAPTYRFDPEHLVTPVDVGHVAINADLAALADAGVALPSDLAELAAPAYRELLVVENPATSSPGLAFLYATIARFGEGETGTFGEGASGDWLDYWAALRDNGVQVTDGWNDAYYTSFSRYGGDRPLVVSYATSPAAEVIFAAEPLDTSPTANVLCPGCTYRQIEAAGILKGTGNRQAAERFIDFLLSPAFQADVPLTMFVYPAVEGTPLPDAFTRYAAVPTAEQTASLAPELIAANQDRWLRQWTDVVQRGRAPDSVR